MQSAQVIFLNTMYEPTEEEISRFMDIQAEIRGTYSIIEKESPSPYEKAQRINNITKNLRSYIRLIGLD